MVLQDYHTHHHYLLLQHLALLPHSYHFSLLHSPSSALLLSEYRPTNHPLVSLAQQDLLMAFLEGEEAEVVLHPLALVVLEVEVGRPLASVEVVEHGCYHEAEGHEAELQLGY